MSLVLHPRNPQVPTVHMNVRFFIAKAEAQADIYWFGGGTDLTPYYGYEDDAHHFHATCKRALEPFGADKYPRFKKWCDEYFYLKHRDEPAASAACSSMTFTNPASRAASLCSAQSATHFSMRTCRSSSVAASALRRARARLPGVSPRPLRGIQSRIRSRHVVRPAIGRPHGIDPDVAAADRALEVRLEAGAGTPEGRLYSDFLRPREWV